VDCATRVDRQDVVLKYCANASEAGCRQHVFHKHFDTIDRETDIRPVLVRIAERDRSEEELMDPFQCGAETVPVLRTVWTSLQGLSVGRVCIAWSVRGHDLMG